MRTQRIAGVIATWAFAMNGASAQDLYFTAEGEEDGKPLVFRALQSVPAGLTKSNLPFLISITWRYEHNGSGMPGAESNDQQVLFEDALESLDKNEISRLALVVTGNGRKEWHWYAADVGSWMKSFNDLLVGFPVFPIEIADSHQPNWDLYSNFVESVEGL